MSQDPPNPKSGQTKGPASKLATLETSLGELPVFPLPQVVLFPRAHLPLHIFEQRYRAMLRDAMASHGFLVIARLCDRGTPVGQEGTIGEPPLCRIAGVGAIVEHELMSDGRANIVVTGMQRIEMEELPFAPPYRRVRAKILAESTGAIAAPDRTALLAAAHSFVSEVHRRDSSFRFHLPPSLEPGAIADLCAHHLVIDADARQAILEELDVPTRITRVTRELAMQQQILGRGESASGRGGGGSGSGGGALN